MTVVSGAKKGWAERLIERALFLVSLSAILLIFLIFIFIVKEAFPVLLGKVNSAPELEPIPVEKMSALSPEDLQQYLDLTPDQYAGLDESTLRLLMEVKLEEIAEAPKGKDARVNSVSWRYLLKPYQWSGYEKAVHIWQPISSIPKYNLVPLLLGSLKITLVALALAVPVAVGAAIYVSQLASVKTREILKPAVEMLAGVPSVVLGFIGLILIATVWQSIFGYQSRLNAFVAGTALALAVIPIVFTIAEDALTSVPPSYREAALALGGSKWHAAWRIVVPAALPGIMAAIVLGFGRAIGETMIVLMASGNASIVSLSVFESARTLTATIAAELAETVFGGHHYRVLFLLGTLLFAVTFLSNFLGEFIIHRMKGRFEKRIEG